MVQSPNLRGLGPRGNRQLEDWGRQRLWVWCRRRNCQSSDLAGIDSSRIGDARGRGQGTDAGSVRAWTPRELAARGLVMRGVVGMVQSLELRGLGSAKNPYPQDEDRRGRGVGVRVNSSTKRKVNNSWGMRNIGPLPPGLAGGRCTAQTFASSAFTIRNGFRARFRATYRNIIRRLIRMGCASVMRRLAGWDPGHPAAPRRSPLRRSCLPTGAARRSSPPPVRRSAPAACRPPAGTRPAPVSRVYQPVVILTLASSVCHLPDAFVNLLLPRWIAPYVLADWDLAERRLPDRSQRIG